MKQIGRIALAGVVALAACSESPTEVSDCSQITASGSLMAMSESMLMGKVSGGIEGDLMVHLMDMKWDEGGSGSFRAHHKFAPAPGDTLVFIASGTLTPSGGTSFRSQEQLVFERGTGKFAAARGNLTQTGSRDIGAKTATAQYRGEICES